MKKEFKFTYSGLKNFMSHMGYEEAVEKLEDYEALGEKEKEEMSWKPKRVFCGGYSRVILGLFAWRFSPGTDCDYWTRIYTSIHHHPKNKTVFAQPSEGKQKTKIRHSR